MRNSCTRLVTAFGRPWPNTIKRWKSETKEVYICPEKSDIVYDGTPDMVKRGIYAADSCDITKAYPQPRVVIIGAGMAGISAAARLCDYGIDNFVILEAYERPGGRIHSGWLGDVVAELGAQTKQDNCATHPVYTLTSKEDPPRPGVPAVEHTRGLFNRAVSGPMPFTPIVSAYYKFRQIEKEAAAIYCHGGSKQHGSMLNFISLRIQQELHEYPEEQQHDAARIMFGLSHMISARSGIDTFLLCKDHCGTFMNIPGGDVRVPLGLVGCLAPLLRKIPEGAIRYCKPVNCVYWGTCAKSGYRAIAKTTDGDEFPADYIIITVSLGVLVTKAVRMFCPALPACKMDSMRCLGFESVNKIFLEYARPFWYWQQSNLNFDFSRGGNCGSGWTKGIRSIGIVPHSKHVIGCILCGREAAMMEAICDKDVAEGVTALLRSCTKTCVPYPVAILRSHWVSDPYFCGSCSFNTSMSDGWAQKNLACPLPGPSEPIPPILLFAGEATIPGHFATVYGARLSGIREAERIVELTIKYKGPPFPRDQTNRYLPHNQEIPGTCK